MCGPQVKNSLENLEVLFKITTNFNCVQPFRAGNQIPRYGLQIQGHFPATTPATFGDLGSHTVSHRHGSSQWLQESRALFPSRYIFSSTSIFREPLLTLPLLVNMYNVTTHCHLPPITLPPLLSLKCHLCCLFSVYSIWVMAESV